MPIQTKNTAKNRAALQPYFTKRAGQMPTKSEWFNILDSCLNIKDDMNLTQEDIEGLTDALNKKLDADQLPKMPTAEQQFNSLKKYIETLINEKTKDIAAAASKSYVPALADMINDSEPVGRIAQYVGDDDDFNRLYAGYFYKKIKEHNPDGDETSEPTQPGKTYDIEHSCLFTVNGEKYLGNFSFGINVETTDMRTAVHKINDRYLVILIAKEACYHDVSNHDYIFSEYGDAFPLAYDMKNARYVNVTWEEKTNNPGKLSMFVNGEEAINATGTAPGPSRLVLRQSDNKPFILFEASQYYGENEKGESMIARFIALIPAYADNLYDLTADNEIEYDSLYCSASESLATDWMDTTLNANIQITPRLPIRGTSDYNTDPAWKMIQVSPFVLDD